MFKNISTFCLFTLIAFATIIVLATSCTGDDKPAETEENYGYYEVKKLFTVDSITVYRFKDGTRYHYFTNRPGTVMSNIHSGKTVIQEETDCN